MVESVYFGDGLDVCKIVFFFFLEGFQIRRDNGREVIELGFYLKRI